VRAGVSTDHPVIFPDASRDLCTWLSLAAGQRRSWLHTNGRIPGPIGMLPGAYEQFYAFPAHGADHPRVGPLEVVEVLHRPKAAQESTSRGVNVDVKGLSYSGRKW